MRPLLSRRAKLSLAALPVVVGCALGVQGDPPDPILNPDPGAGGEGDTGGSAMTGGTGTGGTGTGGTGVSGAGGTSSGASGASTGGSGGSATTGGSSGSSTGGTGGSATTGGSAGKATGGTGGSAMTGGSAGKAMTGGTGGSAMTGGSGGKGGTTMGGMGGGAAGGPPSGMDLLRDNFEMGTSNWTMTPSGVWATSTDATSMDGPTVLGSTGASANSTWRAAYAGEASWTDVQIDARVKITSFPGRSTSYYAGVCARYVSNSSYACFALRSDGNISFRVSGSNTNSAAPPGGNIAAGNWYTVRVVARGGNITAFLNGTEIPSGSRVTSGAPAAGRVALATPGANAVFDGIVVTTP